MKLYFFPGACSLSPHIALREAGLPFDLEQVDLKAKTTKSGADYRAVNPKGSVPALGLDNGEVLTEAAVIVQYIADRKPEAKLLPAVGTMDRVRVQEWLNYVATEIHKGLGPLFNPNLPAEAKAIMKENLAARFELLSKHLEKRSFLHGDAFTVADGYLFTVLGWTKWLEIDLGKWPVLAAYRERIENRPAVQAAMRVEGLLK
ncbi:MAG TPA: glutathione transferase GstA [Stellaceae bacterium]|nr:glutathione transferase GstA [Stellaceae bacterium]